MLDNRQLIEFVLTAEDNTHSDSMFENSLCSI